MDGWAKMVLRGMNKEVFRHRACAAAMPDLDLRRTLAAAHQAVIVRHSATRSAATLRPTSCPQTVMTLRPHQTRRRRWHRPLKACRAAEADGHRLSRQRATPHAALR